MLHDKFNVEHLIKDADNIVRVPTTPFIAQLDEEVKAGQPYKGAVNKSELFARLLCDKINSAKIGVKLIKRKSSARALEDVHIICGFYLAGCVNNNIFKILGAETNQLAKLGTACYQTLV